MDILENVGPASWYATPLLDVRIRTDDGHRPERAWSSDVEVSITLILLAVYFPARLNPFLPTRIVFTDDVVIYLE